jgi:hypothetical protein
MPQKIAEKRLSSPRGRPRGIRTKTFDLLFGRRVTPLALPIKNTKPRHAPQDRILPLIGRAGEINKAVGERTMIRSGSSQNGARSTNEASSRLRSI